MVVGVGCGRVEPSVTNPSIDCLMRVVHRPRTRSSSNGRRPSMLAIQRAALAGADIKQVDGTMQLHRAILAPSLHGSLPNRTLEKAMVGLRRVARGRSVLRVALEKVCVPMRARGEYCAPRNWTSMSAEVSDRTVWRESKPPRSWFALRPFDGERAGPVMPVILRRARWATPVPNLGQERTPCAALPV